MSAILIKADTKTTKILYKLAKDLGANAINLNDEQFEDFKLGSLMEKMRTNELVTREEVFKKLDKRK